ncbi:MAG: TolC family protein, partial [Candidatus Binatia bacterium]
NVESSFKRVGASRLARELAAENLANQQRRYQVGKLTTTDVLDFQQKLASAMAVEQRALNDHARATIRLQRATGILLDRFNIEVEAAETATLPWWARF